VGLAGGRARHACGLVRARGACVMRNRVSSCGAGWCVCAPGSNPAATHQVGWNVWNPESSCSKVHQVQWAARERDVLVIYKREGRPAAEIAAEGTHSAAAGERVQAAQGGCRRCRRPKEQTDCAQQSVAPGGTGWVRHVLLCGRDKIFSCGVQGGVCSTKKVLGGFEVLGIAARQSRETGDGRHSTTDRPGAAGASLSVTNLFCNRSDFFGRQTKTDEVEQAAAPGVSAGQPGRERAGKGARSRRSKR
jgi:hypothetical protein